MSKLYNTQKDITSNFEIFLLNSVPNIRKTQLNIIPSILFGIIQAESIASSDISKNLKDNFLDVKLDSVIKRINRFFRNNYLTLILFINKLFLMLFLLIKRNILTKEFILFLTICFLMKTILPLCLLCV